ncbi:MAG: hypothetical protein P1V51_09525 [Deltaproteobacteria bacterium]|nr:hypothetical protein [Deltaproteobacteria bacterium]
MMRLLLVSALLSCAGCSLIAVPYVGEKAREQQEPPVCNESYLAPVGDHAMAGLFWPAVGIGGALLAANTPRLSDTCQERRTGLLIAFPVTAALATIVHWQSGQRGLKDAAFCRAMKTSWAWKDRSPPPPMAAPPAALVPPAEFVPPAEAAPPPIEAPLSPPPVEVLDAP